MTIRNRLRDVFSPVVLDITQADIDAALLTQGQGYKQCPANIAARRQFPDSGYMFVGRAHVYSNRVGGPAFDGREPLAAFTSRWDAKRQATPTRIRLYRFD